MDDLSGYEPRGDAFQVTVGAARLLALVAQTYLPFLKANDEVCTFVSSGPRDLCHYLIEFIVAARRSWLVPTAFVWSFSAVPGDPGWCTNSCRFDTSRSSVCTGCSACTRSCRARTAESSRTPSDRRAVCSTLSQRRGCSVRLDQGRYLLCGPSLGLWVCVRAARGACSVKPTAVDLRSARPALAGFVLPPLLHAFLLPTGAPVPGVQCGRMNAPCSHSGYELADIRVTCLPACLPAACQLHCRRL
jgi:hypothetical protein